MKRRWGIYICSHSNDKWPPWTMDTTIRICTKLSEHVCLFVRDIRNMLAWEAIGHKSIRFGLNSCVVITRGHEFPFECFYLRAPEVWGNPPRPTTKFSLLHRSTAMKWIKSYLGKFLLFTMYVYHACCTHIPCKFISGAPPCKSKRLKPQKVVE